MKCNLCGYEGQELTVCAINERVECVDEQACNLRAVEDAALRGEAP